MQTPSLEHTTSPAEPNDAGWFAFILEQLRSFWSAGLSVFLLVTIAGFVYKLRKLEFDLSIAVIFGVFLWIMLLLFIRRYSVQRDIGTIRRCSQQLKGLKNLDSKEEGASDARLLLRHVFRKLGLSETIMDEPGLVFELNKPPFIVAPRFGGPVQQQIMEDLDDAVSNWYLPVHALVWSLPALGFLGMAWHMREVIALFILKGTTDAALSPQMLREIAPSIILSFKIILVALGCAVVGYIATAVALRAEGWLKHEVKGLLRQTEPLGEYKK